MATPFRPRSTKQRLADTRLAVRRGPTVGEDSQSRDPFSPDQPPKRKGFSDAPKFKVSSPTFGRTKIGRSMGRY